jgi:hypothetical protein
MRNGWIRSLAALFLVPGWAAAQSSYAPVGEPVPPMTALRSTEGAAMQPVIGGATGGQADTCGGCGACAAGSSCCEPRERVWINAEYLLWYLKGSPVPALVGATPFQTAANSVINMTELPARALVDVFGPGNIQLHGFSGFRIGGGVWLAHDCCDNLAVEGNVFYLPRRSASFSRHTNGDPVLGALFVDPSRANRDTIIVPAFIPTMPPTSIADQSASASVDQRLWGAELNARHWLVSFACSPIDVIGGFRYLDQAGSVNVTTVTNYHGGGLFGTCAAHDHFDTKNQFYGGQFGGSLDMRCDALTFTVTGKIGFGDVHQVVNINGLTVDTTTLGTPQVITGGVLTQASNIGHFTRDRYAYASEIICNLGYQFSRNIRATFGYNFLHFSHILQPGGVIDTTVNPSFIHNLVVTNPVNVIRPRPAMNDSTFWAQGINAGLEFRY